MSIWRWFRRRREQEQPQPKLRYLAEVVTDKGRVVAEAVPVWLVIGSDNCLHSGPVRWVVEDVIPWRGYPEVRLYEGGKLICRLDVLTKVGPFRPGSTLDVPDLKFNFSGLL